MDVTILPLSKIFDASVVGLGGVLAFVSMVMLVREPEALQPAYLIGIPLIMIMAWFPILIGRIGGGIEIGLDICVLIFLGTLTEPFAALAVWSLGVGLGQLIVDKLPTTKAFNTGLGVIAGGLALLVFDLTRSSQAMTPQELTAAGLAGVVYFVVDFALSAISLSLEEKSSIRKELAPTGALGPLAAFLGIASLGYLGALVVRELPGWSAALLVVPIATILVAARAQSRGSEHARRLRILLDAAVTVQTVSDRSGVLRALRAGAVDLLRDPQVSLRSDGPRGNEVGVPVDRSHDEELWVVGPARNRARSTAVDDQQVLAAIVGVAEDAFTRLRLSRDLTHQAGHDSLTELPNRSLFMDRVDHAIIAKEWRTTKLAVLFCDLDGFKRVNDLFGHAAGDELLIEVGRRIRSCVRKVDTVARLGGDEFAVLLEDVADPAQISATCERILDQLRNRFEIAGEDVSVTITIGVAVLGRGDSAESLLSHADLAMYQAKHQGKNRYETYQLTFGDERLQRIALIEALRKAIEVKDLQVVYQPVVDLRTGEIHGVEALARWCRDGSFIAPDLFIPAAEESGLIAGLGAVVLDIVARDVPALRKAAGRRITVGVNISAQELHVPDFTSRVKATRRRMGDVDLVLELTERDFVDNDEQTLTAMTMMAAADVRFAIDDFGVGFSSLGYLQRLPVRILKIDRSFVAHIEDEGRACSLVRSMVVMGQALGLDVVVEGIERLSQLEHVVDHTGAQVGQGDLFAMPMPVAEMVTMLGRPSRPSRPPRLSVIS